MAKYIKTDSSEAGNGIDHADTEGHVRVQTEDADVPRAKFLDTEDTEAHVRVQDTDIPRAKYLDDEDTEGHRMI